MFCVCVYWYIFHLLLQKRQCRLYQTAISLIFDEFNTRRLPQYLEYRFCVKILLNFPPRKNLRDEISQYPLYKQLCFFTITLTSYAYYYNTSEDYSIPPLSH